MNTGVESKNNFQHIIVKNVYLKLKCNAIPPAKLKVDAAL